MVRLSHMKIRPQTKTAIAKQPLNHLFRRDRPRPFLFSPLPLGQDHGGGLTIQRVFPSPQPSPPEGGEGAELLPEFGFKS